FGDDDVADLLGRRAGLHVVALFLFARAAERSERAGAAVILVAERAADGQLAALAMILAGAARTRRLGTLGCGRMAARPAGRAALIFFLFHQSGCCRLRRRSGGRRLGLVGCAARFLG